MKGQRILRIVTRFLGWRRVLRWAWSIGKPQLEKLAARTATNWDDETIKLFDEVIQEILNAKDLFTDNELALLTEQELKEIDMHEVKFNKEFLA